MSNSARALFVWPTPGTARAPDDAFAESVEAKVEMPATFVVLSIKADHVERLDLRQTPHRRTRFRRQHDDWLGEEVNP
jgi:hypothetical protein